MMRQLNCKEIEGLLVDYADGEIAADDRICVDEHLTACGHCRDKVEDLRRSLSLAGIIFDDGAAENEAIEIPTTATKRNAGFFGRFNRLAAAASVLLAFGLFAAVYFGNEPAERITSGRGTNIKPHPTAEMTLAEIKRDIAECGQAAKLLAAANMLSKNENLKEIALQQYKYIVDMYPHTSAATAAKLKMNFN